MRAVKIHRECCGKETFATKEGATIRLRQVLNRMDVTSDRKEPRRVYDCPQGNWHLTSMTQEQWDRLQAYEAELLERRKAAPPPPPIPSSIKLSAIARAAMEVMDRDGACIRCGSDTGLLVAERGSAQTQRVLSKKIRDHIRRTTMSNLITLCFQCDLHCRKSDQGWEGGWHLDPFMNPEQYPVLHHGIWVYLNNDGTVTMAEEVGVVAGDAQAPLEGAG